MKSWQFHLLRDLSAKASINFEKLYLQIKWDIFEENPPPHCDFIFCFDIFTFRKIKKKIIFQLGSQISFQNFWKSFTFSLQLLSLYSFYSRGSRLIQKKREMVHIELTNLSPKLTIIFIYILSMSLDHWCRKEENDRRISRTNNQINIFQ